MTIQNNPSQQVFLTSTKLEATAEITVYSKDYGLGFSILCGLRFLYRGCSNALLGEDSHESQTISLPCPIQSISVHYTKCYDAQFLVVGLMFGTREKDFEVGDCNGEQPDILEITQVCCFSPSIVVC